MSMKSLAPTLHPQGKFLVLIFKEGLPVKSNTLPPRPAQRGYTPMVLFFFLFLMRIEWGPT